MDVTTNLTTQCLCPFKDKQQVEAIWHSLAQQCDVSFFNDWYWIENWLNCLPSNTPLRFVVNFENDKAVFCFFLGVARQRENKITKTRGYVNNTGNSVYDDLTIEYNNPLSIKENIAEQLLFAFESLDDIEELRCAYSSEVNLPELTPYFVRTTQAQACWVDLKKISETQGYLSLLSKNKRSQIKQTINAYQTTHGELQITFAQNTEQALSFLANLITLHQTYWQSKNKAGAFASEFFTRFHQRLIQEQFDSGKIQLIRIKSGECDIGYLYNFVHQNQILFYQSGFVYQAGNKFRPGLISHYLTINHCAKQGFTKYNFLAGFSPYKKSLSTNFDRLTSYVIAKQTLKSKVENSLRQLKSFIQRT